MSRNFDWKAKGFASKPDYLMSPDGGLVMYRAWGASSSEWGSGVISLEKPESVLDAELRFNIADWGNGVHFVSTFRLKPGFFYYKGPVAHGSKDLLLAGTQIFIESPFVIQVVKVGLFTILKHDVTVVQRLEETPSYK
jgi:hypothetical protein